MIKNKHYNVELTVAKCADRAAENLEKISINFFGEMPHPHYIYHGSKLIATAQSKAGADAIVAASMAHGGVETAFTRRLESRHWNAVESTSITSFHKDRSVANHYYITTAVPPLRERVAF